MDTERLHRASAALILGAGGAMQITNLNKALFYFDLEALVDEGATFTGASYAALRRGPVVHQYKTVLLERFRQMPHEFLVSEEPRWDYVSVTVRYVGAVPPDLGSEVRNDRARRIGAWAGGRHAMEVSEFSHDNLAWRAAYKAKEGSTIDLRVAMQQIMDDDPWLHVGIAEEQLVALGELDRAASLAL